MHSFQREFRCCVISVFCRRCLLATCKHNSIQRPLVASSIIISPETWVHTKNPCLPERPVGLNNDITTLLTPNLQSNNIMSIQDFDNISSNCKSLYQTQPGLESATFYHHLTSLKPRVGIRLIQAGRHQSLL